MPATDRPPSTQFYPRDWLADTFHLTDRQYRRYHVGFCRSLMSDTPGVHAEHTWRVLMGYDRGTAAGQDGTWVEDRNALARLFHIDESGIWIQQRMVHEKESQARRRERLKEAGRKSRERKQIQRARKSTAKRDSVYAQHTSEARPTMYAQHTLRGALASDSASDSASTKTESQRPVTNTLAHSDAGISSGPPPVPPEPAVSRARAAPEPASESSGARPSQDFSQARESTPVQNQPQPVAEIVAGVLEQAQAKAAARKPPLDPEPDSADW